MELSLVAARTRGASANETHRIAETGAAALEAIACLLLCH